VIQLCNVNRQIASAQCFNLVLLVFLHVSNILFSSPGRLYCTGIVHVSSTFFNLVDCLHKREENISYKAACTIETS